MGTSWWQAALITLTVALVAGVILLVLEHRSPWFARFQESVRDKRGRTGKAVRLTVQAPGQVARVQSAVVFREGSIRHIQLPWKYSNNLLSYLCSREAWWQSPMLG